MQFINANFTRGLTIGILCTLILGGITYFVSKSKLKNKITLKWWQWIFYSLGWLFGFANLLFWLIAYAIHISKKHSGDFFNKDFHKRVYVWGILMTVLILVSVGLILIFHT